MAYTFASRSQELASPAAKLIKSPPTHFFRDLPAELREGLLVKIFDISTTEPQTLLNLACVDTWLAQRLRNTDTNGLWQNLWDIEVYTIQQQLIALEFAKEALAFQSTETGQIYPVNFNASTGLLRVKIKVSSLAAQQHELQCC